MFAIAPARVIDGTGAGPLALAVVVVDGDRIAEVLPSRASLPSSIEVIEAPESTLLPGLVDAHLHVAGLVTNAMFEVDDPLAFADSFMRRLTAHGILTVRDTGSPDVGYSFDLFKRGRPGWPRFFGSGFNLDGPPGGPWQGLRVVSDGAEAARAVTTLVDGGADFVKLYAWMELDVIRAATDAAHARGARVAAHVGHRVTAIDAVVAGVDALEHVRIGRELLSDDDLNALSQRPPRGSDPLVSFAAWRYIDPDGDRARELVRVLAGRGTVITPTLCLSESVLRPTRRPDLVGDWEIEGSVERTWDAFAYDADFDDEDRRWASVELERQMAFLGLAHAGGVRLAAGTDTPNPYISPGNSLHRELELLVACGLSPLAAIHAVTGAAADLIGSNDVGRIERGRAADLLLVGGDPTTDIRSTRTIETVIIAGQPIIDRR
jgi:imidazolonepropionase-like amidohydrolase